MAVKIATYNIQYGKGQDGRYDLSRTIAAVRGQDIICLQEVTRNWLASNEDDQPGMLADELNMYAVYAQAYEIDGSRREPNGRVGNVRRQFGNMVLSKWPILYSRAHSLPRPPGAVPDDYRPRTDMPRMALEAVVDCDGIALRVVSTHLSHRPGPQRQVQVDELRRILRSVETENLLWDGDTWIYGWDDERPAPPVPKGAMVFGDFNIYLDSEDYDYAVGSPNQDGVKLIDGWSIARQAEGERFTGMEYDGSRSVLDYLFVTKDFAECVNSARVNLDTTASDHFPVFFEIDLG